MNFINNYSQPITLGPGDTSLALSLPDGEYRLTIADGASSATRWEIVGAAVEDGTATLTRGLEGTPVQEWPDGSVIYGSITAGILQEIYERPVGAPGEPWAVVGTTISVSRPLDLGDAGLFLPVDSTSLVELAVPAHADVNWPANCEIHIQQIGAGQVELVADAGVTIITEETLKTRTLGSAVTLKRLGADLWTVIGSLEAAGGGGDLPSEIGQPFGGGFYAGDIQYPDGQWYKLIVADVSADITGENSRWRTSESWTNDAEHSIDGVANTNAMIAAGIELHPAAEHCVNHRGGGFEDWYMPALDELDVIYQNLGLDRPNCPPDFQSGGPQAFSDNFYWASTQQSLFSSSVQHFGDGSQDFASKNYIGNRVRPVRRVPFSP